MKGFNWSGDNRPVLSSLAWDRTVGRVTCWTEYVAVLSMGFVVGVDGGGK